MNDNRTYIRVIFDKILKDNIVFKLVDKIVKFYCTIFSHNLKQLKFNENYPLYKVKGELNNPFGIVNSKTHILD